MERSTETGPDRTATGAPAPSAPTPAPPTSAPEPVQRWRLRFERDALPAEQVGRASMEAWQAALTGSGLPLAGLEPDGSGHARFVLGAPLRAASTGRAELADIWLLARRPAWAVREGLEDRMPSGHRLALVEDVWLGAPPLPALIVAAVWTVTLGGAAADGADIEAGIRQLLDARSLPRVRARGGGERAYDLRPLVAGIETVDTDDADQARLRITTRLDPALGSGRPEEVVAALGEAVGHDLSIAVLVREELILADARREPAPRGKGPARRSRR